MDEASDSILLVMGAFQLLERECCVFQAIPLAGGLAHGMMAHPSPARLGAASHPAQAGCCHLSSFLCHHLGTGAAVQYRQSISPVIKTIYCLDLSVRLVTITVISFSHHPGAFRKGNDGRGLV